MLFTQRGLVLLGHPDICLIIPEWHCIIYVTAELWHHQKIKLLWKKKNRYTGTCVWWQSIKCSNLVISTNNWSWASQPIYKGTTIYLCFIGYYIHPTHLPYCFFSHQKTDMHWHRAHAYTKSCLCGTPMPTAKLSWARHSHKKKKSLGQREWMRK